MSDEPSDFFYFIWNSWDVCLSSGAVPGQSTEVACILSSWASSSMSAHAWAVMVQG